MDFGAVGLEGLVGSDNICTGFSSLATSNRETKQEWNGSELLKQERSGAFEDDWRSSKLSKTESMLLPQRNILLNSNTTNLFPDGQQQQQQMLSFSCPKSGLSVERISQNVTLPGFLLTSSPYNRTTGYNYENFNSANMHGVFTETRGPFTPSQWMELEHQALIYKYITADVPIPSNLLIPIRKALDSAGISSFSGGFVRPNTLSWGSFHFGFSGNTDPEPGRCRRTDGKKWRCSRDAVADQKYCERHMNRGRHRSRKHVEGQSGHSAAAATSTTTAKPMLTASSESASVVGLHGSSATNSQTVAQNQQQLKNLLSDSSPTLSAAAPLNRMFLNKENLGERVQDSPNLSTLSSKIDLKSKENPFFILKQQSPYQESSDIEFGRVNSDSLLNPSHSSSSFVVCRNFNSSEDFTNQQNISQHSIRQFVNDLSTSQSEQSYGLWPQLDVGTDRTQLSISIPVAPIDFTSSTSSPNNEKGSQSPLRFLRDFDSVHMGMGVGIVLNEFNRRQANWIPVPWESSMGGPLGEVLHNCNNSGSECKSSSALNHLAEGWKSSPQLASSPTGVLQKTTFASLSNSSAGSSPRAENHRIDEGASQCSDVLGTRLVHSSSLPAL